MHHFNRNDTMITRPSEQTFIAQDRPKNQPFLKTQHTCTKRTKSRLGKLVEHRDDDAERSQDKYCNEVDELWSQTTVEAVVEPRHE